MDIITKALESRESSISKIINSTKKIIGNRTIMDYTVAFMTN